MITAQVVGHFGEFTVVHPVSPSPWLPGDWIECIPARHPPASETADDVSLEALDALFDEANRAVADAHSAVDRLFGG